MLALEEDQQRAEALDGIDLVGQLGQHGRPGNRSRHRSSGS